MTADHGEASVSAYQSVDVSTADVNDVVLTIVSAGNITGQARLEGNAQSTDFFELSKAHVQLTPVGQLVFAQMLGADIGADGTFLLAKIPPGKYTVSASKIPGSYVASVKQGQTELQGGVLDLSAGVSGELSIIYRAGAPELNGSVRPVEDAQIHKADMEATILLIPETKNADGSGLLLVVTDSKGSFQFKNISPGRYRIFAFEEVDSDQIQNPELLKQIEDKGLTVDLKEGEKKRVELPLISVDELSRMLLRLGFDVP